MTHHIVILQCFLESTIFLVSSEVLGTGVTDPNSNAPNSKQVLESQEGCGVRGSEGNRIVGGAPIKAHEYPWLCSLRLKGGHICGITLISVYPQETILVGAAHCYNKGMKFKTR